MPRPVEPLSDEQDAEQRAGASERDEADRRDAAAAARYKTELTTLTRRIEADLTRLGRIIGICNPPTPKNLQARDMQVAQVEADGWCGSCWRDDQHLEPVAEGRYRGRCRPCGDWRGENGADPPVPLLKLRHSGRRITTAAVAKALGASA